MSSWAADFAEAIKANGGRASGLMLAEVESVEPFKLKAAGETVKKNIYAWTNEELDKKYKRGDLLVVWLMGSSFYILTKAVKIV